jgi:hypothetical protein
VAQHHNIRQEEDVSEKELYQQKKQAQLDEWKAEVDKLKSKASGASADAQMELNKQIEAFEGKIEKGKAKLAEIADAGMATFCRPFTTATVKCFDRSQLAEAPGMDRGVADGPCHSV